jgi:hypothetical protein
MVKELVTTPPQDPTDELVRWIRERIDHEDALVAHRTTWIVSSQAFMFSAYAVCSIGLRTATGVQAEKLRTMCRLLPWAALLSLCFLLLTVLSALWSMRHLRRLVAVSDDIHRAILWGVRPARLAGAAAPVAVPILFSGLWTAIIAQH